MAIFRCECGFQKKAADEHVGEFTRCPKCERPGMVRDESEPVTINELPEIKVSRTKTPAEGVGTEQAADAKTTPTGRLGLFRCKCGFERKVFGDYAGESSKCPKCGEYSTIVEDNKPPPPAVHDDYLSAGASCLGAAWTFLAIATIVCFLVFFGAGGNPGIYLVVLVGGYIFVRCIEKLITLK